MAEGDNATKMLLEAFKLINGTLDFTKLAKILGVGDGEVMRVQFKRMLESEGADVTINGNAVGSQGGVGLAMPKTRSKSSAANGAAKTPSSSDKKRKGNEEGATTTEVASIEETFGQKDKESAVKKKPKTFKAPRTPKLSQRAVPLKGEEAQTRADELA